jgi:membrane protein
MPGDRKETPPGRKSLYERQLHARRWLWSNLTDEAVLVYRRSAQGKDKARVRTVELFLFIREIIREFLRVQGTARAASLAFSTLLSLVPFLLAFSFILTQYFNDLYPQFGSYVDQFLNIVFPYKAAEITAELNRFLANAAPATMVGFITFFVIAFRMFMAVEGTVNTIWKVPSARGYRQKIRAFTMMLFWGPILMGLSFTTRNSLQNNEYVGPFIAHPLVGDLGVLILMFIAFTMLYWLVPSTPVHIRSAALGGAVTAVLFQLVRWGFSLYVQTLFGGRINAIYGAIGLLIVFLIALELMWVVILLGVETSYVYQNLRGLLRASEQQLQEDSRLDVYFALRAMIEIARRFESREEAPSSYRLAEEFGATDRQMLAVLRKLEDQQLVKEIGGDWTGFAPGGDPDRITVAEVIHCIEGAERRLPAANESDPVRDRVATVFASLESCVQETAGAQTVGRIVRELYGSGVPSRVSDIRRIGGEE